MNQVPMQAEVISQSELNGKQVSIQLALFGPDGDEWKGSQAAGDVLMTGYTVPSGSNVLATDTVLAAIHKLDARMRAAGTPI